MAHRFVSLRQQKKRARAQAERDAVTTAENVRGLTLDKTDPGGHWRWVGNTWTSDLDTQHERSAQYVSRCPASLGCVNPDHR